MSTDFFVSPKDYFQELVRKGLESRRLETYPHVESYLVNLLEHYLDARNLYEPDVDETGQRRPQTLAEMYMVASQSEPSVRVELLKKMGDKSLYISGFFGDSLERKIVDIDYYAEMGGAAYRDLASVTREDTVARVYAVFSRRFIEFVDVLTHVSQSALIQNNQSVLRLYDRYLRTGSELARERLLEMGVLAVPRDQAKGSRQF